MAKQPPDLPFELFIRWLYRRRVKGQWLKDEPWGDQWPWGDKVDPWTAIASWIARHTGFLDSVVEEYMSAVGRQQATDIDRYVSRELFKWWGEGNGNVLIRRFWEAYPDVAKSMRRLPRPAKQIRARKRGKQRKRSTYTKRENEVKLRLDVGQRPVDIADALGITEGRISQIVASIERVEKAKSSKSVPMGETLHLRDDYSADDTTPKRTPRQRKRTTE